MKIEYEEENSFLKTRVAGLKHELHSTTLQKQKYENEKKTLSSQNKRFGYAIHQLTKKIEKMKNSLFAATAERGD